jgi:hypothetical protein
MPQESRIFFALSEGVQFCIKTVDFWSWSMNRGSPEWELAEMLQARNAQPQWFAFGEGSWFAAYTDANDKSIWQGTLPCLESLQFYSLFN